MFADYSWVRGAWEINRIVEQSWDPFIVFREQRGQSDVMASSETETHPGSEMSFQ